MAGHPKTPKPRKGWSLELARPLTLGDQTKLATLADARAVVLKRLTSRIDDAALSNVLKLLLVAARTGALSDRDAATDQLEIALKGRVAH
jgi:hypothetical protein